MCRSLFEDQRVILTPCVEPIPSKDTSHPEDYDNTTAAVNDINSIGGSRIDLIPKEKLKALRKQGLEMSDVIKLGRLGVGAGVVQQIRNRWQTSEVAKIYCGGKSGINMKTTVHALEEATGGIVIQKSGGSVYLYRGYD